MEREARQRFVLEAARRLFAAKGVENTSMEDIAAAVDYTRRTLYAYFKSRDEICLLVLLKDLKQRWAAQQKAIAPVDSGLAKILVWARVLYAYSRDNPQTLRLQLYWDFTGLDRSRISEDIFTAFERLNNELADGLRDIFQLGVEDGSLRPDLQVDMCISQFLYSLRSILNRALSPTYSFAKFGPDEYVQHFLDFLSRGIRNTGGTSN
jgi:AcrR family transcriptional regulator